MAIYKYNKVETNCTFYQKMRARWSSGQGVSDMNLMVHGPSPGLLPRIESFTIRKTIYFTAFPSILLGNWGSFARMLEITVMD